MLLQKSISLLLNCFQFSFCTLVKFHFLFYSRGWFCSLWSISCIIRKLKCLDSKHFKGKFASAFYLPLMKKKSTNFFQITAFERFVFIKTQKSYSIGPRLQDNIPLSADLYSSARSSNFYFVGMKYRKKQYRKKSLTKIPPLWYRVCLSHHAPHFLVEGYL